MAATVDIISGGRLDLGVGAGWNQQECDAYGIPLPPLKERFDRFDEGVEALVLLLSQETSNLDGRYVQLRDARCEPKPVQRPHPPIVIGGNGPTRTLRTVARFAQQWNSTSGIEHWPKINATLAQRCAEIDRDPATIERSVNLRFDPAAGAARNRRERRRLRRCRRRHRRRLSPGPAHRERARADRRRPPPAPVVTGTAGEGVGQRDDGTIDRRTLLRWFGVGAGAAALAGLLVGNEPRRGPDDDTRTFHVGVPSTRRRRVPSGPPPWSQLQQQLRGRLVLPAASTYLTDLRLYDPRFDGVRPAAIAFCAIPPTCSAASPSPAPTTCRSPLAPADTATRATRPPPGS